MCSGCVHRRGDAPRKVTALSALLQPSPLLLHVQLYNKRKEMKAKPKCSNSKQQGKPERKEIDGAQNPVKKLENTRPSGKETHRKFRLEEHRG